MRQRARETERASADEYLAKAAKEAKLFRDRLEEGSFGNASLFRCQLAGSVVSPAPAETVDVSGLGADLLVGDADVLWRCLRDVARPQVPVVPVGGLPVNAGSSCLDVVLQILLRLPAVADWLAAHVGGCSVPGGCFACACLLYTSPSPRDRG